MVYHFGGIDFGKTEYLSKMLIWNFFIWQNIQDHFFQYAKNVTCSSCRSMILKNVEFFFQTFREYSFKGSFDDKPKRVKYCISYSENLLFLHYQGLQKFNIRKLEKSLTKFVRHSFAASVLLNENKYKSVGICRTNINQVVCS